MASLSLGAHFEAFVQLQVKRGRYQNASEVVRAGLRLLEDYELSIEERTHALRQALDEAWSDPRPSRSADSAFDEIERHHAIAKAGV